MEYKHLIIVICIISSFLLISAVNAVDLNETDLSDGNAITNASYGSFTELANKINESEGIVNLDKDYVYDSENDSQYSEGIAITKEIVINGNGFSVNGNAAARVFDITSQNVILKEISFVNSHAYFNGIVNWKGDNGSLIGCSFKNNSVSSYGIVQWSGNAGKIINSNFTNNSPSGYGVVYWNGNDGTISNCSFVDNGNFTNAYERAHVVLDYEANCYEVSPYSNPLIRDLYFFKGGAIYWKGNNGLVSYCNFENNSAYEGGAIYWFGRNASINNCRFFNNNAVTDSNDFYFNNNSVISSFNNILFVNSSKIVFKSYELYENYLQVYRNILIINNESITYYFSNDSNITFDKLEDLKDNNQVSQYFKEVLFNMKANASKPVISKITGAKDIVKYYKSSVSYSVRVFDGDSFAVGKLVRFTINKKIYNIRVDRNGFATLKLNQKPGKYTVSAEYNKIKVKNTITVKSTLITRDLKIKVKKTGKFTAKVLSSKGKPLAKKTVKIKFRGKTYKIKTSKKGIATFKVSKNLKPGKYTIKTAWNGLTNSNRITVKK